MPLPFLVVHGDGAWRLLLVALVAIVVAVVMLARKLRAVVRARRATRELDRDRGEGVRRGTLGGGIVATLTIQRAMAKPVVLLHRDPQLWIDTNEGRVRLVGDVRAVSGSRVTTRRGRLPKRTPAPLIEQLAEPGSIDVATLCELSPGDRIVVRGALVHEASSEPSDYRESVVASSLQAGDDEPIAIAAASPRASAPRLSWGVLIALSGILTLAGYMIESAMGDMWRHDCFGNGSVDQPDDTQLSNTHACVLANMMPKQPYVIDHLLDRLDNTPTASDADSLERLELARFTGGCEVTLRRLRQVPQPELLLEEAVRCHDRAMQQLALMRLGKFDEAANLGPVPERAGSLLLLARHWTEAAAVAAQRATDAEARPDLEARFKPIVVRHWKCVAELMRWYGGDRDALDRLRALSPGPDFVCRSELVEMTTGEEHDQLLLRGATARARSQVYQAIGFDEWRAFTLEQTLAGDISLTRDSVATVLARGEEMGAWPPGLWVTTIAPEPTGEPSQGQFAYYTARVVPDVYDGNLAAAHRDVVRASAIATALDPEAYEPRELAILHALVDLYGPKTDTPFDDRFGKSETLGGELQRFLTPGIYLRHGMPVEPKSAVIGTDVPALEAAERGDGSRLAKQMSSQFHSWGTHDVLAVLPRITTARDIVLHAVRWAVNGEDPIGYGFPWRAVAYAAERRALFELGGDHAEAARWAEIYGRYRAAITDRKVLLALALWDLD